MINLRRVMDEDRVFSESGSYDGLIARDAVVQEGVELRLQGVVGGNLVVKRGALVYLDATVGGAIRNEGGRILPVRVLEAPFLESA
ncbi:hypothetical protein [Celeribacter neptunius]|uniref:Polymer-forming protein n=1 Tax=Celeribacter neptunius TaxID=588602 RepID=A0A1I3TQ69_9RHOB|nr:hypothetical protein [Celeribacter neptunius]SFJ72633.1 hypothetical protein SAMN04487991_2820 [Celeribacter neptunius]